MIISKVDSLLFDESLDFIGNIFRGKYPLFRASSGFGSFDMFNTVKFFIKGIKLN